MVWLSIFCWGGSMYDNEFDIFEVMIIMAESTQSDSDPLWWHYRECQGRVEEDRVNRKCLMGPMSPSDQPPVSAWSWCHTHRLGGREQTLPARLLRPAVAGLWAEWNWWWSQYMTPGPSAHARPVLPSALANQSRVFAALTNQRPDLQQPSYTWCSSWPASALTWDIVTVE